MYVNSHYTKKLRVIADTRRRLLKEIEPSVARKGGSGRTGGYPTTTVSRHTGKTCTATGGVAVVAVMGRITANAGRRSHGGAEAPRGRIGMRRAAHTFLWAAAIRLRVKYGRLPHVYCYQS
jgi:hypothetical protein